MALLFEELTGKIINAYYETFNTLAGRAGYSEINYTRALLVELKHRGLAAKEQVYVTRLYLGKDVGGDFIDLVVENKVVVEVKKLRRLRHENLEQCHTYLIDSGLAIGLVFNFGGPTPEFNRLYAPQNLRGES